MFFIFIILLYIYIKAPLGGESKHPNMQEKRTATSRPSCAQRLGAICRQSNFPFLSISRAVLQLLCFPTFSSLCTLKGFCPTAPFSFFSKTGGTEGELKSLPAAGSVVPPASWADNGVEEMGRKVEVKGAACEWAFVSFLPLQRKCIFLCLTSET